MGYWVDLGNHCASCVSAAQTALQAELTTIPELWQAPSLSASVRRSCPGTITEPSEAVGGWPELSADPLCQLDDDSLRAADVAEPIAVFVAFHLADELHPMGS